MATIFIEESRQLHFVGTFEQKTVCAVVAGLLGVAGRIQHTLLIVSRQLQT